MFSEKVCESLGYYVYLLADGHDVFYVGKGKGNRACQHEIDASKPVAVESAKISRIRRMRDDGRRPGVLTLRHNIPTEEEAYRVESVAIDLISRQFGRSLTNCVDGHHGDAEGLMTAAEATAIYDAPAIALDDTPVIMFRIPKSWHRGMDESEIYEATRGWWRLNPHRAANAKYAFAVSKGVVRQIYRPTPGSWRKREPGETDWTDAETRRPRYGFEGTIAHDAPREWLNHNISAFLQRGFQGAVRYHRC